MTTITRDGRIVGIKWDGNVKTVAAIRKMLMHDKVVIVGSELHITTAYDDPSETWTVRCSQSSYVLLAQDNISTWATVALEDAVGVLIGAVRNWG